MFLSEEHRNLQVGRAAWFPGILSLVPPLKTETNRVNVEKISLHIARL